jgi:hydroxyacylglutathione hydrolase
MEQSARQLYASLQRLKDLPDFLQIWPGHGAGSACGKALGAVPQSTLGYERLYNPALQHRDQDAFVRWVLTDQPEPPPYFAVMKRWNRDGRPPRTSEWDGQDWVDGRSLLDAMARGYQVVDVRQPEHFAREHIPGSINIPASTNSATYAGTVLSYDRPIILIDGAGFSRLGTTAQLAMIGLEVSGSARIGVIDELKQQGHRMASIPVIDAASLASRTNCATVIDVRGRSEWNHGHLPHATHVYLGDLLERAKNLKRDEPIVVHCQTGARSAIAASLLMAKGFTNVTNFAGGFNAWRKAGLPIAKEES